MKTLFAALMIVAVAGSAVAATPGPLDLIVAADGTGTMINNGTAAFSFDGYTVLSPGGLLGDVVGIKDNTLADFATGLFPPTIGYPDFNLGLSWVEMIATATNYSEVTMDQVATLQPGGTINLGVAFLGLTQQNGAFTYVDSTQPVGQTSYEGQIIPEPATMSLLGLGALALIRRRR